MSLASDRPPASSPQTEQPFAVLPKQSRSQSGARPKVIVPEDKQGQAGTRNPEASHELKSPTRSDRPGEMPASLKKPYSSLAPQPWEKKNSSEQVEASATAAAIWSDTTEAKRWNDTTEARRRLGTCKKHKIALSPQHECLLCKRELSTQKPNPTLKIVLALFLLAALALLIALL